MVSSDLLVQVYKMSANAATGGQLRPHLYSRYIPWSSRFGPEVTISLIEHENAHMAAFEKLFEEEGIAEEVCFSLGETFDGCMTQEAEDRLRANLAAMKKDHPGHPIAESIKILEGDAAEEFTQMKGCRVALTHPTGQV
jgi:hypothetical protein